MVLRNAAIIASRNILRLYRQRIFQIRQYRITSVTNADTSIKNTQDKKDFQSLFDKHKDKIIFSSYLEHEQLELGYFKYHLKTVKEARHKQYKAFQDKSLEPLPISLRYVVDEKDLLTQEKDDAPPEPDPTFQLPFGTTTSIQKHSDEKVTLKRNIKPEQEEFDKSNISKWMTNYEHFDDTQLEDEDTVDDWGRNYGTPDPTAKISKVPCNGCGALLHCNDPSIPGYLPSEIFKNANTNKELRNVECQRCHFLKQYNIALDVNVEPEEYEQLLQSIRNVKSLVILMVDLLDYPCSIWPGIVDIIGTDRPIIVAANKVDLLPCDSSGYLRRIMDSLVSEINKTKLSEANIKHIALISAKTGWGVENLITAMFKIWLGKGDVFLVGCTNVGKSSLFNALLQSDYCKVQAVDLINRATVSQWPGTTLNLLKFPINRISGSKLFKRTERLKKDKKMIQLEKEVRKNQMSYNNKNDLPTLVGHIGRSFSDPDKENNDRLNVFNERNPIFQQSKWLYDTPGVIHPDQVLSLLTTEELLLTVPKKLMLPQTYYVHEGSSILIGGLARLDLLKSPFAVRFIIFCSDLLPITVTKIEDADDIYNNFVGTELLGVPTSGAERLKKWPGLKQKEDIITISGKGPKLCSGDIVLSSIAFVGVTAKDKTSCEIAAWTPQARGIHIRDTPILPYSVNLKGKRLRDTPAYMKGKPYVDDDDLE